MGITKTHFCRGDTFPKPELEVSLSNIWDSFSFLGANGSLRCSEHLLRHHYFVVVAYVRRLGKNTSARQNFEYARFLLVAALI